jgi:hypothetical protein
VSVLRVQKPSVRGSVAVAVAAGLLAVAPAAAPAGASPAQAPPAASTPTPSPTTAVPVPAAGAPGSGGTLLPPAAADDVRILQGDRSERNVAAGPGAPAPAPGPATSGDGSGAPGDGPSTGELAGLAALALAALGLAAVSTGELRRMLHAWRGVDAPRPAWALPDRPRRGPDGAPGITYSLLVTAVPRPRPHHGPAAAEAARALGATVERLAALDRADVEVLAVVGQDDHAARRAADEVAARHPGRVSVVVDRNRHPRRARALDGALGACRGRVVGVFQPGDEPHARLLDEVEARLGTTGAAAVQAPVRPAAGGRWYAAHQALDRWFWFRSDCPTSPSGGSCRWRPPACSCGPRPCAHGGWDEAAPDEGVELGVRLASAGVAQAAIDRPDLATRARPPAPLAGGGGAVRGRPPARHPARRGRRPRRPPAAGGTPRARPRRDRRPVTATHRPPEIGTGRRGRRPETTTHRRAVTATRRRFVPGAR